MYSLHLVQQRMLCPFVVGILACFSYLPFMELCSNTFLGYRQKWRRQGIDRGISPNDQQ